MIRFHSLTFLLVISVLGYFSYNLMKPFFLPAGWAAVLAIVFHPVHAIIERKIQKPSLAAFISMLVILIVILVPFSYFSVLLAVEINEITEYVQSGKLHSLIEKVILSDTVAKIASMLGYDKSEIRTTLSAGISKSGKTFISWMTSGIGSFITGVVDFLLMMFILFFLLRDGPEIMKRAQSYLPFSPSHRQNIMKLVNDIVASTVYGGVAVAVVQGIVAGLTFWILDVGGAGFWGFATSIASFIPFLGAFTVWGPAVLFFLLHGLYAKALAMTLVGIFGISLMDNVFKPLIIGSKVKMPILVIFLSVLGGIQIFGLIGLVMGPLVIALFISVVETFRSIEGKTPESS